MSSSPPTRAEFHAAITNRSDRWYSACLKITRNPDLAADAVQDALLNAWNKRHQFKQSAMLETWIHRIAVNAALALVRKQKPKEAPPRGRSIAVLYDAKQKELVAKVKAVLDQLPEPQRDVILMKVYEGLSGVEIAARLGRTPGVVRMQQSRGFEMLRRAIPKGIAGGVAGSG